MAHGLGRLKVYDSRDKNYPLSKVLRATSPAQPTSKYWDANGFWGNQGSKPYCVGYGWTAWVKDGPITHPWDLDPTWLYSEAQKLDGFGPEEHDGTSVRAAAEVLKTHGVISNYYWAENVDNVVQAILQYGPVVVGTEWLSNMSYANFFFPTLNCSGYVKGGHCYLLDGVDTRAGVFRMKNSWGRYWGRFGFATLKITDFDRLLKKNGEACLAFELSPLNAPQQI